MWQLAKHREIENIASVLWRGSAPIQLCSLTRQCTAIDSSTWMYYRVLICYVKDARRKKWRSNAAKRMKVAKNKNASHWVVSPEEIFLVVEEFPAVWTLQPGLTVEQHVILKSTGYLFTILFLKQCSRSGSRLDPFLATLWIRIRIPKTDQDPHNKK